MVQKQQRKNMKVLFSSGKGFLQSSARFRKERRKTQEEAGQELSATSTYHLTSSVLVGRPQPPAWVTVWDSRLGENPGPTGSRRNVGLLWITWTDNRFCDKRQAGLDFPETVNPDWVNSSHPSHSSYCSSCSNASHSSYCSLCCNSSHSSYCSY